MAFRVLYVFTARKRGLIDAVARGDAPDTLLFGFNHIARHGIAPSLHEPQYGAFGRAAARQLGRLGPDALQLRTLRQFASHDAVFLTGAWPLLLAAHAIPRRRRPRLVWLNMTLTNLIRRGGWRARLLATAARCADAIVCVAEFQRKFLHDRLAIPYARLPLALSGTDARFYDPARAGPVRHGAAVLAVGRDAGRDYSTLGAAAGAGAPLQARIICSPVNVAHLSLPPHVTVQFDVPPTVLRDEYAAAQIVAVPTHGESSTAGSDCSGTLVLLDALAMGRPAVITQRESVVDYVTPGTHALTCPPADPAALRQRLDVLRGDGPATRTLSEEGRARVLDALTTSHFAERIADILLDVGSQR